ncbi:MAG: hypothetical protein MUD08_05835 [Cytophagales bacterium]|jgi:hypothetical protein|nr:hypothetical protein [Cytophagales bacterium]
MKNILYSALVMLVVFGTTSCFEDIDRTFDEVTLVEFNDPVTRSPAVGVNYPILSVTRTSGVQRIRINLVGRQLQSPEDLRISIDTAVSRLLGTRTIRAVEGTHFNLNGGTVTMRADTSFAEYQLNILNTTPRRDTSAILVLRLDGNERIRPSENYRRLGFRIELR